MRRSGSLPIRRHAARWRYPAQPGPHGGARTSPRGSRAGHHGMTGHLAGSTPGSGRNQPSISIVSHRAPRCAAAPVLGRDARDGPALSGLMGTLSQVRAHRSDDQRSLRARPRGPRNEPARITGTASGPAGRGCAGRFVVSAGRAWQDRSRPRPVAVRREGHRYGNVPRRPPHPLKVFARVQQGL